MVRYPTEAYLYSLEPELFPGDDLVSQAILIASLFTRQVCLTDAQVFVTEGVKNFFRRNEKALLDTVEEPGEIPPVCIALRENGDVWTSLDLRLAPKGEKALPTYDNSLPPSANAELRHDYRKLKTSHGRRERFFRIAGSSARRHVERLDSYIRRDPAKTTLGRSGRSEEQLYDCTKNELVRLLVAPNAVVDDVDRRIADAILNRIAKHSKSEVQTREILHWAVYGGTSPPVYHGRVDWSKFPGSPDPVRNEWRFFLNSIYNYNLAKKLGLRPVLNSAWWRIGIRWFSQETLTRQLQLEPSGCLPLSAPIYRDHLNLALIRKIRRKPAFWASLSSLEDSRSLDNEATWRKRYQEHLQLLSEELAEYLVDSGKRELVGKTVRETMVSPLHAGGVLAGPVVMLLASFMGLSPGSALEFGGTAVGLGELFAFAVEGLFTLSPGIANKQLTSAAFKKVIADIGLAGGPQGSAALN